MARRLQRRFWRKALAAAWRKVPWLCLLAAVAICGQQTFENGFQPSAEKMSLALALLAGLTTVTTTTSSSTVTQQWRGLHWRHTLAPLSASAEKEYQFGRCALVGSSSSLLRSSLGKEIDGHDTVIRVNRLPLPAWYQDFGVRTDVYLAGTSFSNIGGHAHSRHVQHLGGTTSTCRKDCPFSMVVYSFNRHLSQKQWVRLGHSWNDTGLPVLRQTDETALVARCVLPPRKEWSAGPTAGFDTFWTFLPLCNTLRLYGFTGNATADKHYLGPGHPWWSEHEVYQKLTSGDSLANELSSGNCSLEAVQRRGADAQLWHWLHEELQDFVRKRLVVVK